MQTAEETATALLSSVYAQGPPLPIDPVVVARFLGINVWRSTLSNALAGVVARTEHSDGTNLFLNTSHAPVRQRDATAHLLGHVIQHEAMLKPTTMVSYQRGLESTCAEHSDEVFAEQFAAALLMPKEQIESNARSVNDFELARLFGVPLDSLRLRLAHLGA